MSVISRFRAIFEARGNQIADQMEDPKASLDYSLYKLEEIRGQMNAEEERRRTLGPRLEDRILRFPVPAPISEGALQRAPTHGRRGHLQERRRHDPHRDP